MYSNAYLVRAIPEGPADIVLLLEQNRVERKLVCPVLEQGLQGD